MEKRKDPKEKKCAICGKDIYAGEEWAYKRRENGERTKWFCTYKCMRAYDAKHERKQAMTVERTENTEAAAPKEPTSRAVAAKELAEEIKAGRSVIAYLKEAGYKNPWEAYQAIRHYCETNMPEMLEVLKPLKELPKAPQQKTGRPRKQPEVVTVDKVPEIEALEEQVTQQLNLQGGVNYQVQVDESMKAEVKPIGRNFRYQVTGIETDFGRFDWTVDQTTIIFTYEEEEISVLARDWKKIAEHLPEILKVMGVTE